MAKFMYLFRSNAGAYQPISPEQMQQVMNSWIEWKNRLEKSGNIVQLGDRLDRTGKVVKGKARAVTDGPYVEVKDFIQGYMVVEADDIDHAVELAGGCPALDYEGSVEVRPFVAL